jgi:TPR repeat protein
MKRLISAVILCLLLVSCGPPQAPDYQKGYAAFISGDYATALRELRPLAEQGHADAQTYLGLMYQYGDGVAQDNKTAFKWLTLAVEQWKPLAEQGDADAQYGLGGMYYKGWGVPQDYKTALKWWTLAAEQGDAEGQAGLAWMYYKGLGVPQDNVYAYMWDDIAASNGNEDGGYGRDMVAEKMTATQIEKAQGLARECVVKKYKGC